MRRILIRLSRLMAAGIFLLALANCRRDTETFQRTSGFDEFVPRYNLYIKNWILEQQAASRAEAQRLATALAIAEGEDKALLEGQMESNTRDLEKWEFRLNLGDYLKIGDASEIPTDLDWKDGLDQPEIGDPAAEKGGALRTYIPDFPPTLRPFGENSNNSFRGIIYDDIDMDLVTYHRETMELIPGVASQWAVSGDGRTIYYRIDPEARYSDGVMVSARDYLMTAYVNVSDNVLNPYQKQFYRENIAQIAMYGNDTLAISLPEAMVYGPLVAGELVPSPEHFYQEYGADYTERYQWKFRPTTGAYEVRPEDVVKGASITQSRVENWWAKDRKFYRHRFNPDKIVHTVVRDPSKAFELFRAGELDTFFITRPELWYEKSEIPPVYDGYIERVTFFTRFPKVPLGLYLNVNKPLLDNRDVRIGIQHAINWDKVINVIYRGDYQRLNAFNEGQGDLSDPSIRSRPFSITAAREAFAAAGFTEEGRGGILTRPDGTRLSFAITYPNIPVLERVFALLQEEALSCGLEIRLDGLEPTVAYRKEMQKQHEIAFAAWNTTPPMPDFYQFLHSTNAFDEKGNPKPQTNNLFVWGRADTDKLSMQVRNARTRDELRDTVRKLQHIMHDEAIFVPGYAVDFIRLGFWRWVRWPDSEFTRFSPPVLSDPHEAHVLWIDGPIKEETQSARRSGKTFPESTRVVDTYRTVAPSEPAAAEPAVEDLPMEESQPQEEPPNEEEAEP